jgi:hypothetical protein
MLRDYPNISIHLNNLMKIQDINDTELSLKTEIRIILIKKILKGDTIYLSLRNVYILSKQFGMQISEFIDLVSR